jgi:hypothetical protein
MTTPRFRTPFEKRSNEIAFLPIPDQIACIMLEGTMLEQKAIAMVLEKWTELDDAKPGTPFGLYILRKYGFSGPEEKARKGVKAKQQKILKNSMELLKAIAESQGISVEEAETIVYQIASGNGGLKLMSSASPEILELATEMMAEQNSIEDLDLRSDTILMQRAFPGWSEELTEVLHPSIRRSLHRFHLEEIAGVAGEASLGQDLSTTLTEKLPLLEAIENPTGTPACSI